MAGAQAVLTSLIFLVAIGRGEGGVSAADRVMNGCRCRRDRVDRRRQADRRHGLHRRRRLIGAALMLPKAHRDPDSETLATFALAPLSGALAAGAVGALDISLLLYPTYFFLVNGALAILIYHRRAVTGSVSGGQAPAGTW